MTGTAHPARTLPRPIAHAHVLAGRDVARFVAAEAGPSGPVILDAIEAPKAEAVVRQPHGAVGIALAGRDRVSHSGDEYVAHLDLADDALRRAVQQDDVDARGRGPAVAKVGLHFLAAGAVHLTCGPIAVIERPHATVVCGQSSGEGDADAVLARRKVDFALAIAIAEFQELASPVDAQPLDQVACPAAAVALARQAPLGREHAIAVRRGDVPLEIRLSPEQAEPVLDLPLDPR